jgi:uncharacterized protein
MQVNLDNDLSAYTIRGYQPGEIAITPPIQGKTDSTRPVEVEVISGSFVISPRQLIRDWPPMEVEELTSAHMEILAELKPEVILLGTGPKLQFPDIQILAEIHHQQIGIEIMDTAAACRTYNILMTEGRFVVAGMMNQG